METSENKICPDLRDVPNEIIIAAYNQAVDYFTASELSEEVSEPTEEVERFKTIIDPRFYEKIEAKIKSVEKKAKDDLYALHLSHPACQETLDLARKIMNQRAEALVEIDELKSLKKAFLEAISEWTSSVNQQKVYFLSGGPICAIVNDFTNEESFGITLSKGSVVISGIEPYEDDEVAYPAITSFVAYTDYEHKQILDNLIAVQYGKTETEIENE